MQTETQTAYRPNQHAAVSQPTWRELFSSASKARSQQSLAISICSALWCSHFSTALAGGIFRDLLIGAVPPSSLRDWRYSAMAFTGAAIVFFLYRFVQGIPSGVILVMDAAALALFAVAGTEKALLYKMHPFIAVLLGYSYSGWWRHGPRSFSGACSSGAALRYLCHRSHSGIGGHDCRAEVETA